MSCAVFTFIGIITAARSKSNAWVTRASLGNYILAESVRKADDGGVALGFNSPFIRAISDVRRWTCVINCFLDDSGKESNPSEPAVVLAGYMGDDKSWMMLTDRWLHLLIKYGISWVHMRELIPLKGEYDNRGWTPKVRDAILSEFVYAIRESDLAGFGVAVDAAAWKAIPKEIRTADGGDGNAHDFCFARILRKLKDRIKLVRPRDFISVRFDCDQEFSPTRFRRFLSLKERDEDLRWYLGEITFSDPKIYVPLQAADLLAWETRKQIVQKMGGYESTPRWNDLFNMHELTALSTGLEPVS